MRRDVLIGTYTRRAAEGIYRGVFDDAAGVFETRELAVAADNPAFLALRGDRLYAVNEQTDGGISAFARRGASLSLINRQPSGGSLPCHVAAGVDWVAVANYGSGTVALFPTDAGGGLLPRSDMARHEGRGPVASRQQSAHAHEVHSVGDSVLIVPDLGADRIYRYGVKPGGVFGAASFACREPGSGPRHVARHPTLPLLYVLNELGNSVDVLDWISLTACQTVPTLPRRWRQEPAAADGESPSQAGSTTAEIQLAPDARFLYASNRGHDSIVSFVVDAHGRLGEPRWVPTRGAHPRYFQLDPTGHWLIVLNQDTDNVVVYRLDDGRPADVACESPAPTPVCLAFLP